jgi:hypothetical protein
MAAPKGFRRARTRKNPQALEFRLARRRRKAAQRAGLPEGEPGPERRPLGGVLKGLAKRVGKLLHLPGTSAGSSEGGNPPGKPFRPTAPTPDRTLTPPGPA